MSPRAVQAAGARVNIILSGQPLTKAPAYLRVNYVKFQGSATAIYCAGIGADLQPLLREVDDELQGSVDG